MQNISNATIKKIVKNSSNSNLIINKEASEAIARILEKKAERIAAYAVKRAKSRKRHTVTEEDIESYSLMAGD